MVHIIGAEKVHFLHFSRGVGIYSLVEIVEDGFQAFNGRLEIFYFALGPAHFGFDEIHDEADLGSQAVDLYLAVFQNYFRCFEFVLYFGEVFFFQYFEFGSGGYLLEA